MANALSMRPMTYDELALSLNTDLLIQGVYSPATRGRSKRPDSIYFWKVPPAGLQPWLEWNERQAR